MKGGVRRIDPHREYLSEERCHILELSNSPDDAAVSIARARVAPGVTTRWHRLDGIAERYVILDGVGAVAVGDEPVQTVEAGDVVWIPPGERQRIANVGATDLVFLAICTPRYVDDAYEDVDLP
jgi:mannose-6-phosphate isomerase-like protein (cupin superfamily)